MTYISTRELVEQAGFPASDAWRVRRIFEDGVLPEPPRFAGKRAIPADMVPAILAEFQRRGWLPVEQEATA